MNIFTKKVFSVMFHIEGIPGRRNDFFPKNRSRQKFHRFHFSIFFSKFQKEVLEDFRRHLTVLLEESKFWSLLFFRGWNIKTCCDKEDLNNYPLISLLPAIGILFEKLMASRIINFLITLSYSHLLNLGSEQDLPLIMQF